jgi:hypothetical protein
MEYLFGNRKKEDYIPRYRTEYRSKKVRKSEDELVQVYLYKKYVESRTATEWLYDITPSIGDGDGLSSIIFFPFLVLAAPVVLLTDKIKGRIAFPQRNWRPDSHTNYSEYKWIEESVQIPNY